MSDDTQQPLVVKRIKKGGEGAHGGAWKLAYADFMTAMMAFFLLMWLLGSTSQGDLEGIANSFKNPLKVALTGGSGSGDSSSIIKGGGEDLTRALGQVKRGDVVTDRTINLDAAKGRMRGGTDDTDKERAERARLLDLKGQIEAMVEANPLLRQFRKQLLIDITTEGLRIQIVDEKNRAMFDSSSADLKPYTRTLLHEIGKALNGVDNRIGLSGHTDAAKYAGGERGFSNWELSADRANASRRELVAGGLEEGKVARVVGLADSIPLNPESPLDPINRRISIIVLNRRADEALRRESSGLDVEATAPVDGARMEEDIRARTASPPAQRGILPALPVPAPAR